MKGIFVFDPHPPWNFSNFPTWLDTPWNEYFSQKCLCTILLCDIVSGIPREKNLYVYVNSMSNNLNIALQGSFSMAFGMALHGKSDISQTTVNFNYFLSVKNMLEEGLLEHDHITLNTPIYCVTKQQIDNWNFIYELTTIVFHKLSCKP